MKYDVVVIGAGVAGLTTALHLAPLRTLVISKNDQNNSQYAQGGIAAPIAPYDSPKEHFQDTLIASDGTANLEMIKILTDEAKEAIHFLQTLNLRFDTNPNGELQFNREGSHSKARILRSNGDSIGISLMNTLEKAARDADHIERMDNCFVKDLLCEKKSISGIIAIDKNDNWVTIQAPRVIIATGGLGQIFSHTTNPKSSSGDGIAIAKRAGAILHQMEMIQFHPTALDTCNKLERMPLITEALRGSGAVLVTRDGKKIMKGVHPLEDLAPRDIVARTIWSYILNDKPIFLDATKIDSIEKNFPTVAHICLEQGIDPSANIIPITPAAHYLMGGIRSDENGRTNISGLWAVGECTCNGVHGANRLASNSLLECLVFGKRVAQNASNHKNNSTQRERFENRIFKLSIDEIRNIRNEVQMIMFNSLGLIRNHHSIQMTKEKIIAIETKIVKCTQTQNIKEAMELENMIECAKSICDGALNNHRSQGAHYLDKRNQNDNFISPTL